MASKLRSMLSRAALTVPVAAVLSCTSGVVNPAAAEAVARVELLSISPVTEATVTRDTVLVADIKYSIQNYQQGVDYYIAPLFASNRGSGQTFNELDRIAQATRVTAPEGTIRVRYGIARELQSTQLERPIRVWFYLMERTGAHTTRVIGKTEQLHYNVGGG